MSRPTFLFGPFAFDAERLALVHDGRPLEASRRALRVLHALLEADGQVVTKSDLIDFAWPGSVVEESNLSVQVAALRKVLGTRGQGQDWIATVARIGYRFDGRVTRAETDDDSGCGQRPWVAVLPFENRSGDPGQEYFSDGITEDVIAALGRYRWFSVISRNAADAFRHKPAHEVARALGVRYVLGGSVRKSGSRVRIATELIDARNAVQLWADRYDFELTELFHVQDRITEQVVGAIEPELLKSESTLAGARRAGARDMTGWDLLHQGTGLFHHVTRLTHWRSRELFRQARKADPDLAEAHAWLGRVNAGIVAYGWSDDEAGDLHEGVEAALTAVRLDDKSPYGHYALAITCAFADDFDQAILAAERSIELSPGFALGHLVLGMARLFGGDAARAVDRLERGLALNPHDPQNFVWHNVLATALLFERKGEDALQHATTALRIRPGWRPAIATITCCCVALGREEDVADWAGRLARSEPCADALAPLWRANERWRAEVESLLSQASARR